MNQKNILKCSAKLSRMSEIIGLKVLLINSYSGNVNRSLPLSIFTFNFCLNIAIYIYTRGAWPMLARAQQILTSNL